MTQAPDTTKPAPAGLLRRLNVIQERNTVRISRRLYEDLKEFLATNNTSTLEIELLRRLRESDA